MLHNEESRLYSLAALMHDGKSVYRLQNGWTVAISENEAIGKFFSTIMQDNPDFRVCDISVMEIPTEGRMQPVWTGYDLAKPGTTDRTGNT